jgi:serine beta-lactamase-like protein LACTB
MKLGTKVLWLVLVGFSACAALAQGAVAQPSDAVLAALRDASEAEMKLAGSPSIQVAVSYDGATLIDQGFGMADIEHGIPATPTTRYRTASVAKWFTAAQTMRLSEFGKLDLDAPIQTYCPQFPAKSWPITTRELLAHTSGIRHDAEYDAVLAAAQSDTERLGIVLRRERERLGRFTRYDEVAAPLVNFADDPLLFEPGTQWSYSSPDYRVLSCVLQGASGRPYATLMQEDIFAPTGMTHTVPDDAWAIVPERAGLYQVANAQLDLRRADYRDVSENLAAGGYLSTASDLLAFAVRFSAGEIVSQSTISLMTSPVSVAGMPAQPDPNTPVEVPSYQRYGYGIMLFSADDGVWFGHTGRQDGASSILVVSPDRRCAVAVMMNVRSWARGFEFVRRICAIAAQG